ncbi:hypothetical protein [Helicobacter sp. 13S00477-4]|uniref:hypothetical protein n=1 Tax=Helicobacter sp. 13S00477-4 TaxID=1905759 RepID=UPI000BA6B929|nr:hypothetical protein [Helicobacter sp. 13S00477-4]PAF52005.1 hypothetical protein BKH44_04925 [Helicobacter sp. 13S00477-4]
MKRRAVCFEFDISLSLIDAYGNIRECIDIKANQPTSIPLPLKREVYKDNAQKSYYIYDGNGILQDFEIYIPPFVLNELIVNEYDSFLQTNQCKEEYQEIFTNTLKILNLNIKKKDYILHPQVIALEEFIIKKIPLKQPYQ